MNVASSFIPVDPCRLSETCVEIFNTDFERTLLELESIPQRVNTVFVHGTGLRIAVKLAVQTFLSARAVGLQWRRVVDYYEGYGITVLRRGN